MKVRTNLLAGQNKANWEQEWERCQRQVNDLNDKIATLEGLLATSNPTVSPYYWVSTTPAGGQCPATWQSGVVASASGGGYYGEILGQDGYGHYFNNNYTQFYPNGQGVVQGQSILYAPYPSGNERAGKTACISATYLVP